MALFKTRRADDKRVSANSEGRSAHFAAGYSSGSPQYFAGQNDWTKFFAKPGGGKTEGVLSASRGRAAERDWARNPQ